MQQAKIFYALELIIILLSTVCLMVNASMWASPAEEALDEKHDAEIFRAVVTSIEQWKNRHKIHPRHKRAETNTCYGDLGCFDAKGPFSYLDMTPSPPDDIRTRFLMYPGKRAGRSKNLLDVPFENMTTAWEWADHGGFNKSLPTKVIVHGFGSSCTSVWVYEMRSALMSVEECNIICVDWEAGAVIPNYVRAAANTRLVGAQLARLLRGLNENSGLSLHNMHLIGFSLGAHVAGFAGTELGGNISRITGLDPAGPLFESQDPRARLDSSDAVFVDVIHSNGENLILGGLGSWQPMGDVDFYPNGGRMQKGCSNLFVGAVSDIIWSSAVEGRSLCNHRRAYKFFTDSVSPKCQFPAFPCESYEKFLAGKCFPCTPGRQCGNMGYYADQSTTARGQLYLITRDEEPFCAHQYHVKIESSPSEKPVVSYGKILLAITGESELNETFTMTHKDDAELVLGGSLSKILVPHPVLGEPTKITISYIAYSGWLSSGLARWKIDKISFIDSFGRTMAVCQKGLDLETGKSYTLPLYKGDCDPANDDNKNAAENATKDYEIIDTRRNESKKKFESFKRTDTNKFIPTPVIKIGNEAVNTVFSEDRKDDFEMLKNDSAYNIPWKPIDGEFFAENTLDDGSSEEKESSRALNTRAVKKTSTNSSTNSPISVVHKEVVEPILKPNQLANKIARSHNINNNKIRHEISEPILLSTTSSKSIENGGVSTLSSVYHKAYSSNNDWIPTITSKTVQPVPLKWNSTQNTNNFTNKSTEIRNKKNLTNGHYRNSRNSYNKDTDHSFNLTFNNIEDSKSQNSNIISITVQLLPHRLANMLEQAERYARMTLLPLISAHTPKIFSDFVSTFTDHTPKYLPLPFKEIDLKSTEQSNQEHSTTIWNEIIDQLDISNSINETFMKRSDDLRNDSIGFDVTTEALKVVNVTEKSNESLFIVYPVQTTDNVLMSTSKINNISVPKSNNLIDTNNTINNNLNIGEVLVTSNVTSSKNETKSKLYVNLPIFNETVFKTNGTSEKKPKYIPLNFDTAISNSTKN